MINVKMDESEALDLLMERLAFWTTDNTTTRLFESMYESYLDNGLFDGIEFDVMEIVDDDYVNWCDVVSEGDEGYDDLKEIYKREGLGDISCKPNKYGNFIEAYDDETESFLIRW